jgi:hypothetical protein
VFGVVPAPSQSSSPLTINTALIDGYQVVLHKANYLPALQSRELPSEHALANMYLPGITLERIPNCWKYILNARKNWRVFSCPGNGNEVY